MGLEVIAFGRWIEEEMRNVVGNGTLHAIGEISDGGLDSRGNICILEAIYRNVDRECVKVYRV